MNPQTFQDQINKDDLNRTLMAMAQQKPTVNMIDGTDLGQKFKELSTTLAQLLAEVRADSKQDTGMHAVVQRLDSFLKQFKDLQVAPDPTLSKAVSSVEKALNNFSVNPQVNVPAPRVTVQGTKIDLSPLSNVLQEIRDALQPLKDTKETENNSDVIAALNKVQDAITNQSFPVPNYILPFKDSNGKASQVQLDSSGNVPVDVTVSSTALPTAFAFGQSSVGTSAAALASNALTVGVILQALSTNTDTIFIGGAAVTTSTGFELQAGQATSVAIDNTNKIYAISASSSQKLCFVGS